MMKEVLLLRIPLFLFLHCISYLFSATPIFNTGAERKIINETPTILINDTGADFSLTGFSYNEMQGPSALQNFTVSMPYRTDAVVLTVKEGPWEISTNKTFSGNNVSPYQTIPLPKNVSNNTLTRKNIYVRLKNDLSPGEYTGQISVASAGAVTRIVTLMGTVTAAVPVIQVKGGNSNIRNGQETASALNNTLFRGQEVGKSQDKNFTIINRGGAPLTIGVVSITGTDPSQFQVIGAPVVPTEVVKDSAVTFSIRFKPTSIGAKKATVSIVNNDKNPFTFAIGGNGLYCGIVSAVTLAAQNFEGGVAAWPFTVQDGAAYNSGRISGKSGTNDAPSDRVLRAEGEYSWRIQPQAGQPQVPYLMTFQSLDTSAMPKPELRLNIAAFSLGSKTNGMDNYGPDLIETEDHAAKLDYVLVEISPDGGATWHPQAKIVTDQPNLTWGFNSKVAGTGTHEYADSKPLSYFVSSATEHYSELVITNLPEVNSLQVRISVQSNESAEAWLLDDIKIVSQTLPTAVWNGTAWIPKLPEESHRAVIRGTYNTASSGAFNVCQCEVNGQLTVGTGTHITIADKLINNGEIVVETDAGLVQLNDENSYSGSGSFTVKRDAHMRRLDYTYWASPVAGQQLKAFSLATLDNRFSIYNEGTDLFDAISPSRAFGDGPSGLESAAKGYAIRAPNNFPSDPMPANAPILTFHGSFKGVPNNGRIEFPLKYQSLPGGRGYNLIGNPYASNIDFEKLVNNNSDLIEGKAYFWTNINPTPAMQGSNYPGEGYISNYAIFCLSGGICVTTGTGGGTSPPNTPTKIVKTGQGFIVKAKKAGTLTFTNAIRTDNADGHFFSREATGEKDRFWLQLKTPLGVVTTALIAYVEGATDDYDDDYDAELFGLGADALFSQLGGRKLAIQGRAYPLRTNDVVPLGTNHFDQGSYTLRIGAKEGVFLNQQPIYVRDNETSMIINLSESPYTFNAPQGLVQGRFDILYQKPVVLSAQNSDMPNLIVYRRDSSFIVRSAAMISAIEVYDAVGRLVMQSGERGREIRLEAQHLTPGIYILKIDTKDGTVMKKVIK